jgi:hypothetical protein
MRPIVAILLTTTLAHAGDITVRGGQPTPVPGTDLTITLTDVTDQRCPADVACVWEGMIRLELDVVQNATVTPIVLCNSCADATRDAEAAGHHITFTALNPTTEVLALLGSTPQLDIYAATLTITPP